MYKLILLLGIWLFSNQVKSQATIEFCAAVEDYKCTMRNTKFFTTPDSLFGKIYTFVKVGEGQGTTQLTYKVYNVISEGNEVLRDEYAQKIESTWYFAWQPFTLPSPGKYKVNVYNDKNKLIASKGFEFFTP